MRPSARHHLLDHAATTPVRPEAMEAYVRACESGGNASSVHALGRAARRLLDESREEIAELLGADPAEVIFTSGGTEGANLAVLGGGRVARQRVLAREGAVANDVAVVNPESVPVAISAGEHPAVLAAADALGGEIVRLPVDSDSRVSVSALADLPGSTALISMMWVNNETGVVQPVSAVVEAARSRSSAVHSDAVQAIGHVPVHFHESGLDLLSFSGHKIGAPIGIGALLARRDAPLAPLTFGGGQERGVRSGTLNVPGAAALAAALRLSVVRLDEEAARLRGLRAVAEAALAAIPDVRVTAAGRPETDRSPATVHAVVAGVDADALQFALDRAGIAASSGSACRAGVQEPSHVIEAMGLEDIRGGLRCSLGWTSTAEDVEAFAAAVGPAIAAARAAR